jgi:hypothetical protein
MIIREVLADGKSFFSKIEESRGVWQRFGVIPFLEKAGKILKFLPGPKKS